MSDATDNRFYREKERHDHKYMEALRLLKEAHYLAGKSMGDAWYNAATALLSAPSAGERTITVWQVQGLILRSEPPFYVDEERAATGFAAVKKDDGSPAYRVTPLYSTPSSATGASSPLTFPACGCSNVCRFCYALKKRNSADRKATDV